MIILALNFINLRIRIFGLVADSNYQLILSHIAQQHHSCPNDVVNSIESFNRRFSKLLNFPIVDCIVV